jgi:hypothetical protein
MCFEAALFWNKSCAFKCERKGEKKNSFFVMNLKNNFIDHKTFSFFILYINYSLHINFLKKKQGELAKE